MPIVYEGNVAGGRGGGLLFKGIKFWIGSRVPLRQTWAEGIQRNGGEIVALEKMADMLIADPAKPRLVPQNYDSYSWKFIEEALKTGRLPDKEDYLIHPAGAAAARSAGSSELTKSTRTPFTEEDDRTLTEWVRRCMSAAEKNKKTPRGNSIYQDLAEINPRHTWQSWRDRWVKKLSFLPGNREPLPMLSSETEEEEDDVGGEEETQKTKQLAVQKQARQPPNSKAKREQTGPASSEILAYTAKRTKFTPEEDRRLKNWVEEAKWAGSKIGGKKMYQEFAEKNPTHSAEAWRSRYLRVLEPQERKDSPEETSEGSNDRKPPSRAQRDPTPIDEPGSEDADMVPPLKRQGQSRRLSLVKIEQSSDERDISSNYRSCLMAGNTGERAQGDHVSASHREESPIPESGGEDDVPPAQIEDYVLMEDEPRFYDNLNVYVESTTPGMVVDRQPKIRGKRVKLWDLFQAVNSGEESYEDLNWEAVADGLGFDLAIDPSAPKELATYYEKNLKEFADLFREWQKDQTEEYEDDEDADGGCDVEEEGEEGDLAAVKAQGELEVTESLRLRLPREPGPLLQSSPPLPKASKRTLTLDWDSDLDLDSSFVEGPLKRPRLDRNREIPSTPSECQGLSPSRHDAEQERSGVRYTAAQQSRLRGQRPSHPLSSPPAAPQPRLLEPETQDWRFDPQTRESRFEDDSESESQANITPSQQLRQEFHDISPIPFSLAATNPAPPSSSIATIQRSSTGTWGSVPPASSLTSISNGLAVAKDKSGNINSYRFIPERSRTTSSVGAWERDSSPPPSLRPPGTLTGGATQPRVTRRTLPASYAQKSRPPPIPETMPPPPPPSLSVPRPPPSHSPATTGHRLSDGSHAAQVNKDPAARHRPTANPPEAGPSSRYESGSHANKIVSRTLATDTLRAKTSSTKEPRLLQVASMVSGTPSSATRTLCAPSQERPAGSNRQSSMAAGLATKSATTASSGNRGEPPRLHATREDIDRWESLGYPRNLILKLFGATCANIDLINEILDEHMRATAGNGRPSSLQISDFKLPKSKAGVWTQKDDESLHLIKNYERQKARADQMLNGPGSSSSGAAAAVMASAASRAEAETHRSRLEKKHSSPALEIRWDFLQKVRERSLAKQK